MLLIQPNLITKITIKQYVQHPIFLCCCWNVKKNWGNVVFWLLVYPSLCPGHSFQNLNWVIDLYCPYKPYHIFKKMLSVLALYIYIYIFFFPQFVPYAYPCFIFRSYQEIWCKYTMLCNYVFFLKCNLRIAKWKILWLQVTSVNFFKNHK